MKRFFSSIYALLFILSISLSAFATVQTTDRVLSPPIWMPLDILVDNENLPVATDNVMRNESEIGYLEQHSNGKKFTNLLDGYSIIIPSSMNYDLSLSDVCTIFENSSLKLSVFKEKFTTASERLSYLEYSNKFINNTSDHKLEKKESYTKNNRQYHILMWSRKKLSKIQNDKNYYACIDVCEGNRVYTFFFKSTASLASGNECIGIVDSLQTFDPSVPSANAYNKGYKLSSLGHLNPQTRYTYDLLFSDDSSFKIGMFPPEKYGGFNKMEEFEQILDYKFPVFLEYTELADYAGLTDLQYSDRINRYITRIENCFKYAQANKKSIELTLQPPLTRNVSGNMVYELLDGKLDRFLLAYTALIAKYPNVTVLFRLFNEMNGDWCSYSAYHTSRDTDIYKEAYRYIYSMFKKAGCYNIIWVWNPNERSFPNFKWNNQDLYYPGDEYVDVYGITGYNNGTYYEGETWRSFDEIYTPIYERALKLNEKPIMITEFSCSSVGGDKIAWLEDMFIALPRYDKIKLGIWWHAADYNGEYIARPYFMDTPDGMLEVFDKYLN